LDRPYKWIKNFTYNSTTQTFNYYGKYDSNFFTSQFTTTTTLLTVRTTLQMRFVIPNGTSAGVDFIFPLQTMVAL
jgi:hypothetical protein